MGKVTGVLLLLAFSGCATTGKQPFFCVGPQDPQVKPTRVVDGPVGDLQLEVLEPRLSRPPPEPKPPDEEAPKRSARIWYRQQRLRVMADSVPLQSIAPALASALGIHVEIEPEVAPVRVLVYHPETTVMQFLDAVESQASLHVEYDGEGIFIEPAETWAARRASATKHEPLKLRVMWMKGKFSAEQLAAVYCHDFASDRGSATAVDDLLIVKDTLDGLARIEGLKNRMEAPGVLPPPTRADSEEQQEGR